MITFTLFAESLLINKKDDFFHDFYHRFCLVTSDGNRIDDWIVFTASFAVAITDRIASHCTTHMFVSFHDDKPSPRNNHDMVLLSFFGVWFKIQDDMRKQIASNTNWKYPSNNMEFNRQRETKYKCFK